jgi:hypothetical protein
MFDPVPEELPAEARLVQIQRDILDLQVQRYQLQTHANAARLLGDGEDALSPLRKAMERNVKAAKIYREMEKRLIAELRSANDRAFGEREAVGDGVVVER